jgi:hypothetical protein
MNKSNFSPDTKRWCGGGDNLGHFWLSHGKNSYSNTTLSFSAKFELEQERSEEFFLGGGRGDNKCEIKDTMNQFMFRNSFLTIYQCRMEAKGTREVNKKEEMSPLCVTE